MIQWLGVLFLLISMLQQGQAQLRIYGSISCIFMLIAYYNDPALLLINIVLLLLNIKWLYKNGYDVGIVLDLIRSHIYRSLGL